MRHTRKLLTAVGAIAAAGLVLTGCAGGTTNGGGGDSSESPHPGTLTWIRQAASNGWEGDKCVDSSIPLNPAVYDVLLRIEVPTGDGLAPGLAESWEWDDSSNSYVFNLREDAAFSDGKPLVADDVVFSVNEWITGDFSSVYYLNVDHAEAVDEHTVRIVMKQIDTFLPALLTWCTSPIYPADFGGKTREEFFQQPIGAGPYAVAEWEDPMGTAEKITLVPNEHYYGWDGEPPLETIVVQTITDANQRALEFQAKNGDILEAVDAPTAMQLSDESITVTRPNRIQSILVNQTVEGLDIPEVRQAISLAFDRDAMEATLADGSIAAVGALPVNVPGEVVPTVPNAYDPERARELLEDAGATNLSITLLYDASEHFQDVLAQTMQQQLADVGISLSLETTDGNTLIARQSSGDYDVTLTSPAAISPTIFDPISWISILYTWTGSESSDILDAFLAGTSTLDEAEQHRQALAAQDFITTDNGMIGLVNTPSTYAAQPWVEGFTPLQYGYFYLDTLAG